MSDMTCPVHKQTDCSPLLNGCTRLTDPTHHQRQRYETAARLLAASSGTISDEELDTALASLVADGLMEVQGEGEARRYRLTPAGQGQIDDITGGLLS